MEEQFKNIEKPTIISVTNLLTGLVSLNQYDFSIKEIKILTFLIMRFNDYDIEEEDLERNATMEITYDILNIISNEKYSINIL